MNIKGIVKIGIFATGILATIFLVSCLSIVDEQAIPFDEAVIEGQLDNGLRYFIRENNKPDNRAELHLVVNAGSILEDENQRGLAHFLEHMAFNGTELYPKNELVSFLQSLGIQFGSDINAYTSFDETVYRLTVSTDIEGQLEKGLEVLEQWAFHMLLNEQDVIEERGVVLEELRLSRSSQQRYLDELLPVLLNNSLYAERLPIGLAEIIESASPELLRSYYTDWYRPELMAVVAVGDFDSQEVETIIRERFSQYENPEIAPDRSSIQIPPQNENRFLFFSDPELPYTTISIFSPFPIKAIREPADYRQVLIESIFYSMINERLFEVLQDPESPFINVGVYPQNFIRNYGFNGIYSSNTAEDLEFSFQYLFTEIERIRLYGFLDSEFERAQSALLSSFEVDWKNRNTRESESFVSEIQDYYLNNSVLPPIDWEWEIVQKFLPTITLDDFAELISSRLNLNNVTVSISGPKELESVKIMQNDVFAILTSVQESTIEPWVDIAVSDQLLNQAPAAGEIVAEEYIEEADLYRWELSNNAVVYAKQTDFEDDEILFSFISPGGLNVIEDDVWTSGQLASEAVSASKIGGFNNIELQKFLADKQASMYSYVAEYSEGGSGYSTIADLETLLQLNYLYFTMVEGDTEAWQAYSKRLANYLENINNEPRNQYQQLIAKVLYDDHFRSQPLESETLSSIDYQTSLSLYRDRFANAGDFQFFFVGSFDYDVLKTGVEQWIASIPGNSDSETQVDRGFDLFEGKVREELRAGFESASIVSLIWNNTLPWTYDAYYDMASLSDLLDILLIESLREELGGVYSVGSYFAFESNPEGRYRFIVQFGSDPDRVDELIKTVQAEIQAIIQNGVDESYIQRVSEGQSVNYTESLEQNYWWLSQMQFITENELDWSYAVNKTKWYDSLTSEQLQSAAQTFLGDVNYAEVILYPEDK